MQVYLRKRTFIDIALEIHRVDWPGAEPRLRLESVTIADVKSVRLKLAAIVALCVLPAFVAAILRTRESEKRLREEVKNRVDVADEAFLADLDENIASARIIVRIAAGDPKLRQSIQSGSREKINESLQVLRGTYRRSLILALDSRGQALASTDNLPAPPGGFATKLAPLFRGQPFTGLVALNDGVPEFSLVVGEPLELGPNAYGALVMASPLDESYLAHTRKQIGSHWSFQLNGTVVAATPGHPAPSLIESPDGLVTFMKSKDRLFAVNSFKPESMQAPNQDATITAAQDVTDIRNEILHGLWRSLAILGVITLIALAVARRIGRKISDAVQKISAAAEMVETGKYQQVEGIRTGDEIERLAENFNRMVSGLRERDHYKEVFGKYHSRQVAERMLKMADMGGESVQVTVLFSDIRSFTAISEKMEPKALLDLLNIYFHDMVESVHRHHGVVDKFIGDAIMAVFGAPEPHADDAQRAIRTALEMRARLGQLNESFQSRGLPKLRVGIGVHTGVVVAGNMGHTERREYTVIGDTVNLASRLEGMTKELPADILISEDTYLQVQNFVEAEPLKPIQVRGRAKEVMVYRLVSAQAPVSRAA